MAVREIIRMGHPTLRRPARPLSAAEIGSLELRALVDDMVDSRWTFTVISALLRAAGCSAVFPMALALNSP